MHLKLLMPTEVLVDEAIAELCAEAENGAFCLLPRHVDFVAALVPGLLTYRTAGDEERLVAVDEGVLVKCGALVTVSVHRAVAGGDLETLRATVRSQFREEDERERAARTALVKLEADAVRRFAEMGGSRP